MNNIREFEPKLEIMEDDYRDRFECSQMREMVNACRKGLNKFLEILTSSMSSSRFTGKNTAKFNNKLKKERSENSSICSIYLYKTLPRLQNTT